MPCEHLNFRAQVNVQRLTETDDGPVTGFAADVTVTCLACGVPFRFSGLPHGVDRARPTVSANAQELRVPIEPAYVEEVLGQPLIAGTA